MSSNESELSGFLGLQHAVMAPEEAALVLRDMAHARESGQATTFRRLRDRVVAGHLRFALTWARRYRGRGLELDDVVQHASCGLVRACETFDPSVGVLFSTYAGHWIRSHIQRAIADHGRTVRVPVHVVEAGNRVRRASRRLGREPSTSELADATGLSEPAVRWALEATTAVSVSLDAPVFGDHETLGESLSDANTAGPEETLLSKERVTELRKVVSMLPARERAVLSSRYGLDGDEPRTLGETGDGVLGGLCRERARQVQVDAVARMRRHVPDVRLV